MSPNPPVSYDTEITKPVVSARSNYEETTLLKAQSFDSTRRVRLTRDTSGFGMTIKPGPNSQGAQITVIVPDGVADRSGELNVWDMIVEV